MSAERADRGDRHRLRRPRHRRRLRRAGQRGVVRGHRRRRRSSACSAARCRSTSPAWRSCCAQARRAAALLHRLADALEHARLLFVAVGTPPTYSGDADLSAVHAVVDAIPASDEHALVMKSTVPCGTGAAIQRVFGEQGKDGLRYVSCPEFLKEGSASRTSCTPTASSSATTATGPGDAVVELYAPLGGAAGAHRHRQRRDDQARLQRLPGDQDLVHQRDRQRLRGDRRRRGRGRARHGPGRAHRAEVPAGRDRLRRQLLPQGRRAR